MAAADAAAIFKCGLSTRDSPGGMLPEKTRLPEYDPILEEIGLQPKQDRAMRISGKGFSGQCRAIANGRRY